VGYMTDYEITTVPANALKSVLQDVDYVVLDADDDYEGPFDLCCKWYDHEKDLLAASRKHSGITIRLQGNGERSGDRWVKFFRSGLMQTIRQPDWVPPLVPVDSAWANE
jgi:hypothetical protein